MSVIGQNYYNHPYMTQWNKLHPGIPFPTPQNNPTMFPQNAKTKTQIQYIDPLFPNCNAKNCPKGLIDYRCQYQYSCWLNLGQLVIFLICTLLILAIVIAGIGKLVSIIRGFFSSVLFMTKMVSWIGSCLECLSFGMMEKQVVVQIEIENEKKLTSQQQQIAKKLQQIDIQVNFQVLDKFKTQKLANILDDCQITSGEQQQEINKQAK